jgi:hypothetical protein
MPIPATALLVEFPSGAALPLESGGRAGPGAKAEPERTAEAAFAEGREEGLAAGRAEERARAEAEFRTRLDEAHAAFDARLAQERAAWAAAEGASLAERLAEGLATLRSGVEDAVAAILAPFVEDALRTHAVAALREALAPILSAGASPSLRISGPGDLITALRDALGPAAGAAVLEPGEGPDVRVVADRTLLETQLQAWSARIRSESV